MGASILVAYATRYGSTTDVAEAVAEELTKLGHEATVELAKEVRTLQGFDAVVLGAPLYIGSLGSGPHAFLKRFAEDLERLPVAVFVLGPLNDKPDDLANIDTQIEKELAKVGWLKPVSTKVFGGALDPTKLRFPDSMLNLMPASPFKDMPPTDVRDWEAIRAWAASLPEAFGLA